MRSRKIDGQIGIIIGKMKNVNWRSSNALQRRAWYLLGWENGSKTLLGDCYSVKMLYEQVLKLLSENLTNHWLIDISLLRYCQR